VVERQWGCGSWPAGGCLSRLTPWSRRGVEFCLNFRKLGVARM
jgi:hypothetical protein